MRALQKPALLTAGRFLAMGSVISAVLWTGCLTSAHAQNETPAVAASKPQNAELPPPLPKFLKGRWSNPGTGHSDLIEIEVLEMSTARDGRALVTFWPYCRKSETPVMYERSLKVWRFTATNCSGNANQINMRVRPVEGSSRMEGWYGREGEGRTVSLEFKP